MNVVFIYLMTKAVSLMKSHMKNVTLAIGIMPKRRAAVNLTPVLVLLSSQCRGCSMKCKNLLRHEGL